MIVTTVGGTSFCEDCYSDLGHVENDFELHVHSRRPDGTCETCGLQVSAGVVVDNPLGDL